MVDDHLLYCSSKFCWPLLYHTDESSPFADPAKMRQMEGVRVLDVGGQGDFIEPITNWINTERHADASGEIMKCSRNGKETRGRWRIKAISVIPTIDSGAVSVQIHPRTKRDRPVTSAVPSLNQRCRRRPISAGGGCCISLHRRQDSLEF